MSFSYRRMALHAIRSPQARRELRNADIGLRLLVGNGTLRRTGKVGYEDQESFSRAAVLTLRHRQDKESQRLEAVAGTGAYTINVRLARGLESDAGAEFNLVVVKAASTNPTVEVRDGVGGPVLLTINNGNAETWNARFMFDGTKWKKLYAGVADG